jgi:hypothetical protein
MPDKNKKFHEFALHSSLFKGRSDWYFCYLKAERIAHVLILLKEKSAASETESFDDLIHLASALPQTITHFVTGEMALGMAQGDIFALLSGVRLAVTQKIFSKENGHIIALEYEQLAQKLSDGVQLSPFVSSEDFSVPALPSEDAVPLLSTSLKEPHEPQHVLKDTKGQFKDKGQNERASLILDLVRKRKSLSIKDISAVIRDCSEKTIQRELSLLISKGLVRKQGDRRWSVYLPA